MLKRIINEPLAHFLVLGAILFVVNGLVSNDADDTNSNRIVIDNGIIRRLGDSWAKQWNRAPTPAELDGLIDNYIREEVLFREAMAMGLDRDDTIIRRRLAQKMEFLSADLAMQAEPTDEQLQAFLNDNSERFAEPPLISFRHVYFNLDKRGQAAKADANALRAALQDEGIGDSAVYGDRFMLDDEYGRVSESEVARLFGRQFAAEIFTLEQNAWTGPVDSGFGIHLVRIFERTAARVPSFEDIREKVRNEFLFDQRKEIDAAVYAGLMSRYEIIINRPSDSAAAP